jgi:hypothetical protein
MNRRDFLKDLGLALAAGWAGWSITRLPWPRLAWAGAPNLRLALLADAHLKNGDPARPEAQALARAVAEIRANKPAPNLVLFAGDLAHAGDARALALGQEILSDLPAPLLMVRGEGDGPAQDRDAWTRLFGEPRFAHTLQGAHILGLNTAWRPPSSSPGSSGPQMPTGSRPSWPGSARQPASTATSIIQGSGVRGQGSGISPV